MTTIASFLQKISERNQGFWTDDVLCNTSLLKEMEQYAEQKFSHFSEAVVLGIGGSALGIRVLLEAKLATNDKKMWVADTVDPFVLQEIFSNITWDKTLFFVITKSGGTVETLSQYFFVKKMLEEKNLPISHHMVAITDATGGFLREEVHAHGLESFPVPKNVGGRFSVLTPVGLLPALFLGISAAKLLEGAKEMQHAFLDYEEEKNMPFAMAKKIFSAYQQGKKNLVFYVYAAPLFRFSDWLRQLLAESTGKKFSSTGDIVFSGITPIPATGVTDHHSQNQLYLEGPCDKFFIFLTLKKFPVFASIPVVKNLKFSYLSEKNFEDLFFAEQKACQQSLLEMGKEFVEVQTAEISAKELGKMFFFWEAVTAFLGEFLHINAFDQPAVERTKIITKEILEKVK